MALVTRQRKIITRGQSGLVEPSPIKLGYYLDERNRPGDANLFSGERHGLVFGLNGAGKSTRFLLENLALLRNRSIVTVDLKGELYWQTHRARERLSPGGVWLLNPLGVLRLPSCGFNPMAGLEPDREDFFLRSGYLVDAIVEISDRDPHWGESAQGLGQAAIMFEAVLAKREERAPSLFNVRQLICEADQFEEVGDNKIQVKGLKHNAGRMINEGGDAIASLVARFVGEHGLNELAGIKSTFDTQTRFVLDPAVRRDLEAKNGLDLRLLPKVATSVFLMLPPLAVTAMRRWTRLVLSCALLELMQPSRVKTLFILDEFRASVGNLKIVNDVWALVRGYGIQLMPLLQSATQLEAMMGKEWENYIAQSGMVATIGATNDRLTSELLSSMSGNTTIWQQSMTSGDSMGQDGRMNMNDGLNYGQAERRFLLPQEIASIPPGHGRIWTPGMGNRSIPFFAPNYWKVRALKGLIDDNPLRAG